MDWSDGQPIYNQHPMELKTVDGMPIPGQLPYIFANERRMEAEQSARQTINHVQYFNDDYEDPDVTAMKPPKIDYAEIARQRQR